jgi:hypothetical protein
MSGAYFKLEEHIKKDPGGLLDLDLVRGGMQFYLVGIHR